MPWINTRDCYPDEGKLCLVKVLNGYDPNDYSYFAGSV